MFMILKKRSIVIIFLVLAVIITLILCKNYATADHPTNSAPESYTPVGRVETVMSDDIEYTETKMETLIKERERARESAISSLNDTVNNAAAPQQARSEAAEKINQISNDVLLENVCEEFLKSKGFNNVLVYINEKSVNVSVFTDELTKDDIAKIKDIIVEQTNNNNIKIVAVN